MRSIVLMGTFLMFGLPAFAEAPAITGPTEVGTTTMPPGQYDIVDQNTHKGYELMVTQKGNMIMSPSSKKLEVREVGAPAAAAAVVAPAAAVAAPAAAAVAPAAAAPVAAVAPLGSNDALKGLMNKGLQRGMSELAKQGTQKKIEGLLK